MYIFKSSLSALLKEFISKEVERQVNTASLNLSRPISVLEVTSYLQDQSDKKCGLLEGKELSLSFCFWSKNKEKIPCQENCPKKKMVSVP